MPRWVKVHEEQHGDGSRGRWTWRLRVGGGWLVLVRAADDSVWGGLTFVHDPQHENPPEALPE